MTTYAISWRTRDRNLIRRVCAYLNIPSGMNVNRLTRFTRQLTEVQRKAIQPLVDKGDISIITYKE